MIVLYLQIFNKQKQYPIQNLSRGFIKIFLKLIFLISQPRYSYEIYLILKNECNYLKLRNKL